MKIRTGFVSNSSSSSFCLYGIKADFGEEEFFNICDRLKDKQIDKLLTFVDANENTYIGRTYDTLGENETGSEFKKLTRKLILKVVNSGSKVKYNEKDFDFAYMKDTYCC